MYAPASMQDSPAECKGRNPEQSKFKRYGINNCGGHQAGKVNYVSI